MTPLSSGNPGILDVALVRECGDVRLWGNARDTSGTSVGSGSYTRASTAYPIEHGVEVIHPEDGQTKVLRPSVGKVFPHTHTVMA